VHGLPSLHARVEAWPQTPPLQKSPSVHELLSLQGSAFGMFWQPSVGSQESVVQAFWSSQLVAAPGKQAPAAHVSPLVHTLLSVQGNMSSGVAMQPLEGSQVSAVQGFPSSQLGALPATHAPPWQVSPTVQALPSSQLAVVGLKTQPAKGSQLSAVQGFWSSQTVAAPGRHAPSLQVSAIVQALPSSQPALLST
jgi:hypothetical protein